MASHDFPAYAAATGTQSAPSSAWQDDLDLARCQGRLPRHLAVVMDGNGRWAQARGLARQDGHRAGAATVRTVTRMARRLGLRTLTLYAFSAQNWARPRGEVDALMGLLVEYLAGELREMRDNGIRLLAIGDLARLPLGVRAALEATMRATADGTGMTLCLCLSYGGREEIVAAARRLAAEVQSGRLALDAIDETRFESALWTAPLAGPPDLIVRTSGERRLSNFLLWQCAYAELWFTDTTWPEFGEPELAAALLDYARRQRRFGRSEATPRS
ncbi:MAG: di-trans,poly-cis-decaprenylcistransferase [Myxococcales bacterium]|nr:di-trans,poly-cis-decaprenylcistransferase [Myxococcales bacterium]